jgi:excisionase family DNA binding protein
MSSNLAEIEKITEPKFSVDKVAEAIGVHRRTVARLLDSGKLGYYQVGDRRIVGASHLQLYLSLAERKGGCKFFCVSGHWE